MGDRTARERATDALFDFARVTATKIATSTKQVLASLAGNVGVAGTEAMPYQVLWGHAAIMWRPPADTEVLFTRRAEEMVALASREVRWLVELAEGDVVIRNLNGDTPARIRLLANGEVLVESTKLACVNPGDAIALATRAMARADLVDARVTSLQQKIDTHVHSNGAMTAGGDAVLGIMGAASVPLGALATVASTRVFSKD